MYVDLSCTRNGVAISMKNPDFVQKCAEKEKPKTSKYSHLSEDKCP